MRVKRSDFDALLDANYTGKRRTTKGVWDGEVPAPVSPDELEKRESAPPQVARDSSEAESDKPTG